MPTPTRPYLFSDTAVSICSTCYRRVDAKIVFQEGCVYLLKRCPRHGPERVLIADDVDYYRRCREVFLKVPEQPCRNNTAVEHGCPYDCGLCPDHEQHSCLTLLEVTDHCNLRCPVCYAESGPERGGMRDLATLERMLDAIVANEGEPDVVQLSGGEPTLHPQFFEILDACRRRPIRHLMVNTNGLRIAQDRAFAERLASYQPAFELYLQFDSLEAAPLLELRGADLRATRLKALETLNELDLSTSLVVTVKKGCNDGELGRLVEFAAQQRCVRGVTFQPIQHAGRTEGYDPGRDRLTLTELRRKVLEQTSLFAPEDILPVPCHPDSLAMAYALKVEGRLQPLTRFVEPQWLIEGGRNTIQFEKDPELQARLFQMLATNHGPEGAATSLSELLCCLPKVAVPGDIGYRDVFRLIFMQFIDAESFDLRSVRKSCVHIAHPDGRIIPFDTYNLFYRDGLEQSRLAPIRAEIKSFQKG